MNTGMQDTFSLSWKLAMVIRGVARPSLLDSYSVERSAVGEVVLRNAGRLTRVAIMRNPMGQAVRNFAARFMLGLSQVQHRMSEALTELDIAYPESPLSVRGRAPDQAKAGERWPPAELPDGTAERATAPRFTIIADAATARSWQRAFRRWHGRYRDRVRAGWAVDHSPRRVSGSSAER